MQKVNKNQEGLPVDILSRCEKISGTQIAKL